MVHSLSIDLRKRVVGFIEEGHSRNEAAARFKTSVSFAVNLMRLWKETGSVEPRPRGGFTHGKAAPHKTFILATVVNRPDITMPELAEELLQFKAVKIDPSNLSKFLISCGLSY